MPCKNTCYMIASRAGAPTSSVTRLYALAWRADVVALNPSSGGVATMYDVRSTLLF